MLVDQTIKSLFTLDAIHTVTDIVLYSRVEFRTKRMADPFVPKFYSLLSENNIIGQSKLSLNEWPLSFHTLLGFL